ncbi:MAG: hypothetical protein WKF77_18655 [Planctomycetaceae bacterium]
MNTPVNLAEIRTKLDQESWKPQHTQEALGVRDLEEQIAQWLHCDHVLNHAFTNFRGHTPQRLRDAIEMQYMIAEIGESLLVTACTYPACDFDVERLSELSEAVTRLKASAASAKKFAATLDAIIAGDTKPVDEFHKCMKSKC